MNNDVIIRTGKMRHFRNFQTKRHKGNFWDLIHKIMVAFADKRLKRNIFQMNIYNLNDDSSTLIINSNN